MEEGKHPELLKINAALDILNSAESNLIKMMDGIRAVLNSTKDSFIALEEEKKRLEEEKKQKDKTIGELGESQRKLLEEYQMIKADLEAFSKMAAQQEIVNIDEISASLKIYTVLLNEVFSSAPYFKVLFLLHGDAEEMTTTQLKNASGISGAMILHACHELARVNLIAFDEETSKAKLIKRLYPKKEKKEK
jgi:hypothetical protein